jgi:hypothetical protein
MATPPPNAPATDDSKKKPKAPPPPPKKAAKAIDARVSKVSGVSFDTIQTAIAGALREKYPPQDGSTDVYCDGPWVRDVFDDNAVFTYQGKLLRIPYTFDGSTATLSGEPEPVMVTYVPVGAAPPPAAAPPPEAAKAARKELAKKADEALSKLAARATPAKGK